MCINVLHKSKCFVAYRKWFTLELGKWSWSTSTCFLCYIHLYIIHRRISKVVSILRLHNSSWAFGSPAALEVLSLDIRFCAVLLCAGHVLLHHIDTVISAGESRGMETVWRQLGNERGGGKRTARRDMRGGGGRWNKKALAQYKASISSNKTSM